MPCFEPGVEFQFWLMWLSLQSERGTSKLEFFPASLSVKETMLINKEVYGDRRIFFFPRASTGVLGSLGNSPQGSLHPQMSKNTTKKGTSNFGWKTKNALL